MAPTLLDTAGATLGNAAVRAAAADDEVCGVRPRIVVEPLDAAAVAATLAWASRDQLAVVVRGAGTALDWGTAPSRADVLLSTVRLNKVVAHRHGDLTATVEAGATLVQVNAELARHGQMLPLDPPGSDRATIGGVVAANDSGPRRHRYGTPRDLIIGVELARADGRLAHGGGIVVKNVAGYDLPRLLTGSFGSLAVIVSATFKLFPVPPASRSVVIDLKRPADVAPLVTKLVASPLTPAAVELAARPVRLLVRFESTEAAAERQATEALALLRRPGRIVGGADETSIWSAHAQQPWDGPGCVAKLVVLPSELAPMLTWLERDSRNRYEVIGRAGLGVLLVRLEADDNAQARTIAAIREQLPAGRGSLVLRRATEALKARVGVWGPIGDALPLMRAVKQQFDPQGILNPGRGWEV